ncbi:2,3-bisphosphoglycerate-independent phosphoglycerate mutase [Candidatus Photodesmus katoptron]|uniref:2,3-bisphosphoglycerate-independent phosphoglycerate mutase n=1 Tax=Candidatus Photodesmus katoptron Akat1 TaxID=1236703 RepID=S3DJT6_9GAMM|nr:2,3-bisphosphoglycerate-independent phosphoglycerate mutase [Candidatus Photodesmus katoptron]EPE37985.1 2,3-bisphosphoglycerate-independent phosphoglycerate mutase [Candidatus Photodesmus katoptron Akat1]KEY90229.1 2,3-bisphosphoglycerate-independent phosphoglycerate mutase [Candidatus Photodesmus katoptron]
MSTKKPMVLVILDGWGYREDNINNAVNNAKTPIMDELISNNPNTIISASGVDVGLPDKQMGNSEVGHTNIGAGRVVYQDLTRISKAISNGNFFNNPTILESIDKAKTTDNAIHIIGLLSPGGIHSHEEHIYAAIKMAVSRSAKKIYLHCFLDGRDTPPCSARNSLQRLENLLAIFNSSQIRIASLIGRYYAMDRDNNWDRIQFAYDLLTLAKASFTYDSALEGLSAAYLRQENDEFIKATEIRAKGQKKVKIQNGDTVIFMNYRADRARQLTSVFLPEFNHFRRIKAPITNFVMLTKYSDCFPLPVAFPTISLHNTYGEWLSKKGYTQLRISETEKYAHVTFFFNCGIESKFKGEVHQLVTSPKVPTYDLQPEMNSKELTNKLIAAIKSSKYDSIVCNYPNPDMVGHTGVYEATKKAIEAIDICIGEITKAIIEVNGQLLITADHGNAEMMVNPKTGSIHTAHTNLPVPLIYVGNKKFTFKKNGKLSDLAPTMLYLANINIPTEMTGNILIE